MAFDIPTEEGRSPTALSPGFWLIDQGQFTAQQITDWITPGAQYPRNTIAASVLGQIYMDAIQIFREGQIVRNSGQKYIVYISRLPNSLSTRLRAYNAPQIKFLGSTWSQARIGMNNAIVWAQCWPSGRMNEVVFGWENAAS